MSHVQYVCGRARGRMDVEMRSGVRRSEPKSRGIAALRRRTLKGSGRATQSSDAPLGWGGGLICPPHAPQRQDKKTHFDGFVSVSLQWVFMTTTEGEGEGA